MEGVCGAPGPSLVFFQRWEAAGSHQENEAFPAAAKVNIPVWSLKGWSSHQSHQSDQAATTCCFLLLPSSSDRLLLAAGWSPCVRLLSGSGGRTEAAAGVLRSRPGAGPPPGPGRPEENRCSPGPGTPAETP